MKISKPITLLSFLFGFVTLAACSSNQVATFTPGALPSSTQASEPTSTPHPSPASKPTSPSLPIPVELPTNTLVPQPTWTPRPPPPTSTPLPTVPWTVTAIEIQDWPSKALDATWDSNSLLSVSIFNPGKKIYSIDALSGKTIAIATPDDSFILRSEKSENYEIECSDQGQTMYHRPDRQRVSVAALTVSDCHSVAWAKNESAASLVTEEGDIYVWRTNGTAPYFVGHTTMASSSAAWSPDSRKLVVPAFIIEGSMIDGDSATFNIAYPDGKPMRTTGAKIGAGNGWWPWRVSWLTNTIIQNWSECGYGCQLFSYHDAMTGKYLIDYTTYFGENSALLSPDERWLALATRLSEEDWKRRNPAMVIYDLKNHKSHVWAPDDNSFALTGWASDSHEFYFVCYPLEGQEPGSRLGLIALDPFTLKTKVVIPNVVLVNESPDHHSALVITAAKIESRESYNFQASQLQAAVYTLDGKRTTSLQAVTDNLNFSPPAADSLPSAWSHTGNQVVFADSVDNIWLLNTEGESIQLASGLPTEDSEDWPYETIFNWSPDDRRLFVYRAHRAWVVTIN